MVTLPFDFESLVGGLGDTLRTWASTVARSFGNLSRAAPAFPFAKVGLCAVVVAGAFAASYLMTGAPFIRVPLAWAKPGSRVLSGLKRAALRIGRLSDPGPVPELVAELPEMLDIVNLGLTAGLSFDASLHEYCLQREGALAAKLGETQLKWQMGVGTRQEMLTELAREVDEPSFARFATAVNDSLEMGTPLTQTLSRQARLAREEQRAAVEERIERAPVKMLVPLGSLVVPAMLLAIVGPLVAAIAT